MAFFHLNNISITGMAAAVPKQVVTVDSFREEFGAEAVEKFKAMTGICQFHKTKKEQTASDLGFSAADRLLREKDIPRDSVGLLLFVTQSPDYIRPATSYILHKRLGLAKNCAAFDINLGCSGFVYAVQIAGAIMEASDIQTALVVVAETSSKILWPKDKSVAMLFGDSGTATLLQKGGEHPIQGGLWSKGEGCFSIVVPGGSFRNPDASKEPFMGSDGNEHTLHNLIMDGTNIMQFSITEVPRAIKAFAEHFDTDITQYDHYVLHQANAFILKQLMRKFKIPQEKVPLSLDRYGNTSGTSIPLTICDLLGENDSPEELHLFSAGFGTGLSFGVMDLWLNPQAVLPIEETEDFYAEGILAPESF